MDSPFAYDAWLDRLGVTRQSQVVMLTTNDWVQFDESGAAVASVADLANS